MFGRLCKGLMGVEKFEWDVEVDCWVCVWVNFIVLSLLIVFMIFGGV